MKQFIFIALLIGFAAAAPTSNEDDEKVIIDKDFFPEEFSVYKSQHDIVRITVPLNSINFDENEEETDSDDGDITLFFVEADKNAEGKLDYKGLHMLKNKTATTILENGRDSAADNGDSKLLYIGASDGIYVYNATAEKTEKYGTVTDAVLNIAKANGTDIIYILTDSNEIFKITDEGKNKEKLNVANAQQIVLDFSNNLYYNTPDHTVYVIPADGSEKVEFKFESTQALTLVKPPFVIDDGIPALVDKKVFILYVNGTKEDTDFEVEEKPSAYASEATLIQYYAHNKNIYEYNLLVLLLGELLEDLKKYLDDKTAEIQSIATRSRSDLRA